MALSLILRNSTKLRGLSALPRCTFQLQNTQNFSQLVAKKNVNAFSLVSKCRLPFVKLAEQKRCMSADHSKLWPTEKLVSLLLLGVVPATFFYPDKILDNIFALAVVIHFHWGLEACIVDYIRPILVGHLLPKLARILLYIISASTLAGLIYYNQTQIGIGATLRKFWCITGSPSDNEEAK